jgi:acetyl-CoA carboxylase carboxyltransferase component
MGSEPELDELRRRRERAAEMGGPDNIAKQRARGKLTVRERLDGLVDKGTFREFRSLVGESRYDDNGALVDFTPGAEVEGLAEVDGRRVALTGGDFTIRGGSGTAEHGLLGAETQAAERALRWRIPLVRLLDSAGGSVRGFENLGRTYLPDGGIHARHDVDLLSVAPVVATVLGSVAGLPAIQVPLAHFSVMPRGIGHVFPGGPPVVKAALGIDVDKEDLGGAAMHTRESGVVDNVAVDEADAFRQVRAFLSYLPTNVDELPPRSEPCDAPSGADELLRTIVPRNRRIPFDARTLIRSIVDEGSLFEIAPDFGRARITGLARLGGYPVAVMANNPNHQGGATGIGESEKAIRLIRLADTFHLPLVSVADEPGFMVGVDVERRGIERVGARLLCAVLDSVMPWVTVAVGRIYGVAGTCQHRPTGMYVRYAWPSARWGSMHVQGGVAAAYKSEIAAAPDPVVRQAEIEARIDALGSPFRTAEATGQDIIDPAETRDYLLPFVEDAQRVLRTQLGPPAIPYRP